jgi:hypothetical protein
LSARRTYTVKEALGFIHRFHDTKGQPIPKLVSSARLRGGVLVVVTDHDRTMPELAAIDDWTERRWTLFVHGTFHASGIIEPEDQ